MLPKNEITVKDIVETYSTYVPSLSSPENRALIERKIKYAPLIKNAFERLQEAGILNPTTFDLIILTLKGLGEIMDRFIDVIARILVSLNKAGIDLIPHGKTLEDLKSFIYSRYLSSAPRIANAFEILQQTGILNPTTFDFMLTLDERTGPPAKKFLKLPALANSAENMCEEELRKSSKTGSKIKVISSAVAVAGDERKICQADFIANILISLKKEGFTIDDEFFKSFILKIDINMVFWFEKAFNTLHLANKGDPNIYCIFWNLDGRKACYADNIARILVCLDNASIDVNAGSEAYKFFEFLTSLGNIIYSPCIADAFETLQSAGILNLNTFNLIYTLCVNTTKQNIPSSIKQNLDELLSKAKEANNTELHKSPTTRLSTVSEMWKQEPSSTSTTNPTQDESPDTRVLPDASLTNLTNGPGSQ